MEKNSPPSWSALLLYAVIALRPALGESRCSRSVTVENAQEQILAAVICCSPGQTVDGGTIYCVIFPFSVVFLLMMLFVIFKVQFKP